MWLPINWLAKHLKKRFSRGAGALVVVTHDRWFLDEVCLRMWEVHDGIAEPFEGGYSAYILQRVERQRQAEVAEQKRQNLIRRELAFLSRGARARSSKPRFHVETARALIAEEPPLRNTTELKRAAISRLGKKCVDVIDASFSYGQNKVLDDVTWMIGPGDRYGLLGANGAGKSTLLDIVQGKLRPQTGLREDWQDCEVRLPFPEARRAGKAEGRSRSRGSFSIQRSLHDRRQGSFPCSVA